MATTTHGEVDIKRGKTEASVAFWDDVECGRVVEDVIVERKFAAKINKIDELMEIKLSISMSFTWG